MTKQRNCLLSLISLSTTISFAVPASSYGQDLNLGIETRIESETSINIDIPAPHVDIRIDPPDYGPFGPGSWIKISEYDVRKGYDCLILKNGKCGIEVWGNIESLKKNDNQAYLNLRTSCLAANGRRWYCASTPNDYHRGITYRFDCANNKAWDRNKRSWTKLKTTAIKEIHKFACAS